MKLMNLILQISDEFTDKLIGIKINNENNVPSIETLSHVEKMILPFALFN